ncbi:hypothetical protein Cgig2_000997 [Carnegiea gigantea]|uniref:Uncharacterized protein n=1 Tax=Carnegiea gigantea TaxID=171969 RepID=A0A9Q1GVU2_9CARY|nr:hypothetical protein Cgig2_000997 [Carnegiea gigantea]
MVRPRIALEEYLKSIEHKEAACEDLSLDNIDMTLDLEEDDLETIEENTFELRVSIEMNSSLITIPDNYKDDREHDNVGDDQRDNTPLASEHIRCTLATVSALAKNYETYIKDVVPNSIQGVNKSSKTQIGKKHVGVTTGMEYFTILGNESVNQNIGMPQFHNFVNQVNDQKHIQGENTNTSGSSKQLSITQRRNFDPREPLNCVQGVSKLTSMPSPLSREPNCSRVIKSPRINGQTGQHRQFVPTQEEMNHMSHSLTMSKWSQVEFGASNHGVIPNDGFSGDGYRRLVGSMSNQQAQNLISAQNWKEIDTSDFHISINLPKKQANQRPHNQKHSLLDHVNNH